MGPSDDVDKLYVSKTEAETELSSTGDSVDASIKQLGYYIERHVGNLITAARNNTASTE